MVSEWLHLERSGTAPQTGLGRLGSNSSRQTDQAYVPSSQGASPDAHPSPPDVAFDRLRWTDILRIASVGQRRFLDAPRQHASPLFPMDTGVRQLLPLVPTNGRVFVARSGHRVIGYVVFRVSGPDRRWLLQSLGAENEEPDTHQIWQRLIEAGVVAAGQEGTKRLYARTPAGQDLGQMIGKVGFAPYMREFVLDGAPGSIRLPEPVSVHVRRQHRTDVWAIHQLYLSTTPQPVQFAEAYTSHQWDINQRFSASSIQAGWLLEEGHRVVAYVRAESRPDTHVVEFMCDPDFRSVFPQVLGRALGDLTEMSPRHISIIARGYQQECIADIEQMGFSLQQEQQTSVKYTVVPIRSAQATIVSFPSRDLAEPAGKRVPTFLKGTSGDPASEPQG